MYIFAAAPRVRLAVRGAGPFLRRIAVALLLAAAPPGAPATGAAPPPSDRLREAPVEHELWGTVVEVTGRSELVIATRDRGRLTVRLLGVELPEPTTKARDGAVVPGQPFSDEAAAYLRELLLQKQVSLEEQARDKRGPLQALVLLGDLNVNLLLVREGLAWVSPGLAAAKVRAPLEVAEKQAQVGRYGLWSLPHPEPPWEFRRRQHSSVD